MARFLNTYDCPDCGTHWADESDCTCDDRCPGCNLSCSPSDSEDLDDAAVEVGSRVGHRGRRGEVTALRSFTEDGERCVFATVAFDAGGTEGVDVEELDLV